MHQPVPDNLPVKFIKLKNGQDLVAYILSEDDKVITLKRPLAFTVENEPMYGRQMLNVHEWVAPIVAATDTVPLDKDFVIFVTEVKDSFRLEFKDAVEYLYGVTPRKRDRSRSSEANAAGKVIPFASMMKDPSGKPN